MIPRENDGFSFAHLLRNSPPGQILNNTTSLTFRRYTVAPWGYYGHLIYFQIVPSLRGTVSAGPELRGIVLVMAGNL